jgi:hypothetical protein
MDKETLRQMIDEQKQAVRKAQEQLHKLCALAAEIGLEVEEGAGGGIANGWRGEIEDKRREIMAKVEKIRQDAMEQVRQAMSASGTAQQAPSIPALPSMPLGGMVVPPFDFRNFMDHGGNSEKRKP